MTIENQIFEIYSNSTAKLNLTVSDGDLTGATINFLIHKNGMPKIKKSTSSGISITDGPNGKITIKIDPIDTAQYSGEFEYEIKVIDYLNDQYPATTGTITIKKSYA
jgi:hypothetical protein